MLRQVLYPVGTEMAPARWIWFVAILVLIGTLLTAVTHATPALDYPVAVHDGKCRIFTHLLKSGRSTMKVIPASGFYERFDLYGWEQWRLGDKSMRVFANKVSEANEWNVVVGGYAEALRCSPPVRKKCDWFTLFRHPTARMVSAFYYCKRKPGDKACASMILDANDANLPLSPSTGATFPCGNSRCPSFRSMTL